MNAIVEEQPTTELKELKTRLKATWMTGNYDLFARFMEKDSETVFRRLGVTPGARLLDVACGAGQLALIAAKTGAKVTGCDIATNWLQKARERAAAEGLKITFDEADAEALPYEDGQFDVVTTLFGAMFAPRPDLVAAELTRVCRAGGRIAMANWTPAGFIGKMFKLISRHIAPSSMPSPVLWGEEASVLDRLCEGVADLKLTHQVFHLEYPFPPDEVVDFFRINYGPMVRAFASLDANAQENLHRELVQLWSSHNRASDGTTKVDAEYLEVIATRGYRGGLQRRRARALADRIEEGAAALAAFVEGLSEAEWRTPMASTGTDRRSVGIVVHHVASVYPIEIDLARAVASGKTVSDVTWEAVAGMNAKHAADQANVTKTAALDLLRRNSRQAATAVREFTDDELDRAAPFSLSFGAPVTAQFVIEDHALRHSWHHLARIRTALKR